MQTSDTPTQRGLAEFPWDAMAPYAKVAASHEGGAIDLSVGSPVDATPKVVTEALAAAADAHRYPLTAGTAELRSAIAAWYRRRRGVTVAEDAVLPTIGSKELVALLPLLLGLGPGDAVVFPQIAYPTYAVGAQLVGAEALALDNPADWPQHTKLVWLNSPSNPDGRVLDIDALREAVVRARELGAVIVSDECYAELGWEGPWRSTPIPSVLDPRIMQNDHTGVLATYSLSKQSNLAGYRAAFVAGDPSLIARLLAVRKHAGLIVAAPVQAAMVAALGDDAHVEAQKQRYGARREVLLRGLRAAGFQVDDSIAGLYLWATLHEDAWQTIAALAQHGILAGPGHIYGEQSRQHVRFALTASDADIAEAARRLEAFRAS